tara:strand:- start:224 stop:424 length:201 start_codon:yes stop_codon:yes gene_type:complete
MDMILNYIFIGFISTFLLDYLHYSLRNHPLWKEIPVWTWGARILFALFWPIGISFFIYTFIKERFR